VPRLVLTVVAATVIVGLLMSPPLHAAGATQTWSGKGDGESWTDAHNWSSSTVPGSGDSVVIAPTSSQPHPQVINAPGIQLQDLTLTDSSVSGGALTVTGQFTWSVSSGYETLGAPLTVEGTASITGAGEKDSKNPLRFEGTTTIAGPGVLSIQDVGAAVSNSGALTLDPGAAIKATVCCATTDELLNTGTIAVPASASGTVGLGYLRFDDRGSASIGHGSVLEVFAGPGQFGSGASVTGGGTLLVDQGAQLRLAASMSVGAGSTIALAGNAELFGPGAFSGAGSFSWSGGTIDGNLNVGASIQTTISGSGTKTLTSPNTTPTSLTLHGPTTVDDTGDVDLTGATSLLNLGTMTMKPGALISGSICCVKPDHVTNKGTLTVAAGSGTATVSNLAFTNAGTLKIASGTLAANYPGYVQTSGQTQLAGGTLAASHGVEIHGGTLSGSGTITGSVVNGGTVSPGTTGGALQITGDYQQTAMGVLASTIAGSSQFGQLKVGGAATLAGTLKVNTASGFAPTSHQSFPVLLYRTRSGKFTTDSGSPPYSVTYAATAAKAVYP
jgi:fibronectin-binding autotransporter adhesin